MAFALGAAIKKAPHQIVSVHGRDHTKSQELAALLGSTPMKIDDVIAKDVDIVILAISDNHINEVSNMVKLGNKSTIVVHTSGSIPLYSLNEDIRLKGVIYPLQTISKTSETDFAQVPFCLNAADRPTLEVIKKFAESLTSKIYVLSDDERKKAHLAAVMVNNFTNHLVSSAYNYLEQESIPSALVQPLLKQTMEKLISSPPDTTQTGPARRNDTITIQEHLKLLDGNTIKRLYEEITNSIIEKYHNQ